jgi:hypothetical protein
MIDDGHTAAEKERIRAEARKAVDVSGQKCAICGGTASERHHEDYDRPLDVIPLCCDCHERLHAGDRSEAGRRGAYYRYRYRMVKAGFPAPDVRVFGGHVVDVDAMAQAVARMLDLPPPRPPKRRRANRSKGRSGPQND